MRDDRLKNLEKRPAIQRVLNHLKLLAVGLLVILVPVAIAHQSFDHVFKIVKNAAKKVAPGVAWIERTEGALAVVALIVLFCWSLGWFLARTETDARWLEWANSKYLKRSPLWKKHAKRFHGEDEESAPVAQPALASIQGTWQPGVIVERAPGGWCTVFVPEVPSLSTGRVFYVREDEARVLEMELKDFRKALSSSGRGSGSPENSSL